MAFLPLLFCTGGAPSWLSVRYHFAPEMLRLVFKESVNCTLPTIHLGPAGRRPALGLVQQINATTRCNNSYTSEHTHAPRRPCHLYHNHHHHIIRTIITFPSGNFLRKAGVRLSTPNLKEESSCTLCPPYLKIINVT